MNNIDFSNHPVFNSLDQMITTFDKKETRELVEITLYNNLITQLKYTKERLNISIPALVQKNDLNHINSQLTQSINETSNFLSNKNVGHLTNVQSYLNASMAYVQKLPIPIKGKFDFSRKISLFEDALMAKTEMLESRIKKLSLELESLDTNVLARKRDLKALEENVTTKISNYNTNFENQKISMVTDTEAIKEEIVSKVSDFVPKLEKKLKEAENLLGIIGNVGVTGNYQKIANHHNNEANRWRWIALAFMVVLIIALLCTIYHITNADFNWQVTLIRIIAFSALLYPATYASKEAARHRNLETINRKSELELASINPFIESLSEEKKHAIKEKLVEKFFGNNTVHGEKGKNKEELVSIGGLEKIMNMLLKIWNK